MKTVEGLRDVEERKRNSNKYLLRALKREIKDCREAEFEKLDWLFSKIDELHILRFRRATLDTSQYRSRHQRHRGDL